MKNGNKDRDAMKTQLPPHEVRGKLDEYEREEQQLANKENAWLS